MGSDESYIIIPMLKHPQPKQAPTFLDKFEGRKQAVNRDGLLQLLSAKQNTLARLPNNLPPPPSTQKNSLKKGQQEKPPAVSPVDPPSPQKHDSLLPKRIFLSQELQKSNGSRSERALRGQGLGVEGREETGEGNRFKLPIIARSHSQSGGLIGKHVFTPQVQMIESDRPYRRGKEGSFYSKQTDRATKQMELDQYVLRHLEFLDKFERQLLANRPALPGKGSRSEW